MKSKEVDELGGLYGKQMKETVTVKVNLKAKRLSKRKKLICDDECKVEGYWTVGMRIKEKRPNPTNWLHH